MTDYCLNNIFIVKLLLKRDFKRLQETSRSSRNLPQIHHLTAATVSDAQTAF